MGIVSYPDQKIKKKFGKIVSKKLQNITRRYVHFAKKYSKMKDKCNYLRDGHQKSGKDSGEEVLSTFLKA